MLIFPDNDIYIIVNNIHNSVEKSSYIFI